MSNPPFASFFSFSRQLFLSVMLLFITFAACFLAYQYHREKEYKIELLNSRLQDYNERLFEKMISVPSFSKDTLDDFIRLHPAKGLRVTVILPNGKVIYDNKKAPEGTFENHLTRPEVQQALKGGTAYYIHRTSESLGLPYFYSAKYYQDRFIIRTALPYDVSLMKNLQADPHYIWFTLFITLILGFIFYQYTRKLGTSIRRLQEFAMKADRNEPIGSNLDKTFPHNELGAISRHIIQIYKSLRETKEALYIEREKLITHLQISREGLGIFTAEKKEILVNNLFNQYSNLLSDQNLIATEDFFTIPELKEVTDFIHKNVKHAGGKDEKRMSVAIHKNGKIFLIECIIFQDGSFEISINDITHEEEQIKLKRQLTQNIAHELKTPISSIQGYLETIVNNQELPKEKMSVFLERCYAQSNRLSRLLRDISVLTRMDEASDMISIEKIDITSMVNNIFNEVALELEEKNITANNRLKEGIILRGNFSLIYSIFRNLTDNVIAYAGTDISFTVRCFREDEKFYYFSFADTGIGVAPEHLGRLFERFYRIDKGRSRKLGGTGLGLAIVKNAVLIHGGNISAKPNPEGGLEFIFTLAK